MTVNRTTLLDLPLPVTGTESGTWGDTTNNGLSQYMDIAIAGMNSLTSANFTAGALTIANTLGDSSATNIAAGSAQYATIKVSSLAVNSTITAPSSNRSYRIINADATYSLTIKASGQTGVTFLPGQTGVVAFNGTDYVIVGVVGAGTATDNAVARFDGTTGEIIQNSVVTIADSTGDVAGVGALSMSGNLTLSGGTANGVLYLNGSKVATSGSALTFDGSTLNTKGQFRVTDSTNAANYLLFGSGANAPRGGNSITAQTSTFVFGTETDNPNIFIVNGAEQMRLTSTGLGVGTSSPGAKLELYTAGTVNLRLNGSLAGGNTVDFYNYIPAVSNNGFSIAIGGTNRLTLDSSGNLGLGVTPSNAYAPGKVIQVGVAGGATLYGSSTTMILGQNVNIDASGNLLYATTGTAVNYRQASGAHSWYTAPSGTAGNAISFTQAMTLDAIGRLLIGQTSSPNGYYLVVNTNSASNNNAAIFTNANDADLAIKLTSGVTLLTPSTGVLAFGTSSTERARITSGGDLLVGNTGGTVRLTVSASNPANGYVASISNSYATSGRTGTYMLFDAASLADWKIGIPSDVNAFIFYDVLASAERARITSGGQLLVGTPTSSSSLSRFSWATNARTVEIENTNASLSTDAQLFVYTERNTTNNSYYYFGCYNGTAGAWKLRIADSGDVTNTNGTYGTISDQKMKTDIVDAGSQWSDIKALRFRKFKMKDDPSGLVQLGVVAQEVELTSPGLVDEHIDRDAEGNDLGTTTKSVKTSVLLMKAAVALQEAMARIETLEAKVAQLEGTQP